MASTSKTTHVSAPPEEVLDVIADLASYPQWTDGITEVTVLDEVDGWPTRARFTLDQPPISDTYVLQYTYDVDDSGAGRVAWSIDEPGSVVTGLDGAYLLAAACDGTDVTYELDVDVRLPLPGMIKRSAEKKIVSTALQGLARRVAG